MIALPVLMCIQAAAAQGQLPEVVTRPRLERNGGVDFHALVAPDTVYVGQQATYKLGVFLDQEVRGRLRRNPEFTPPESRAMLAYDLPDPGGSLQVNRDGRSYEVHVFRRALFPLTPGRYTIAPARLAYTLPQGQSFFSREESFSLRSEQVTLVAIDPPASGRPPDWSGAVGVWRASARVDSFRDRRRRSARPHAAGRGHGQRDAAAAASALDPLGDGRGRERAREARPRPRPCADGRNSTGS